MGFGLVVCWVRGALHCCITSWWRFLEVNGHCIVTFVMLILVPCNLTVASGFIFPICEWGEWCACSTFLLQWSIWEHPPTYYLTFGQEQAILLLRWESSVRKRKNHKYFVHSVVLYGAACFLYDTYPVSPDCWKNALLSVENCSLVFWHFFRQDFMGLP